MVTYSKCKNNHIHFSVYISFNRNMTKFAASRHVPWALNTWKCVCGRRSAANAFLVYLEPRECAWWLWMSWSSAGGGG